MTTMRMLSNARKELHAWDALVTERSAVAKAAREAHDQAIEARDKWIELVKTIEADLGTTGED